MQILKALSIRVFKEEGDGLIFDRILKLLTTTAAYNPEKIRIRLEDFPPGVKRTSAVDRATKAYPELAPFRGEVVQHWNNNQRLTILSNFETRSDRRESRTPAAPERTISSSTISQVFHGIPRRFPFWHATVLFDDIDLLNTSEAPISGQNQTLANNDLTGPGITLESRWWSSGRLRQLTAIAALSIPTDDSKLTLSPQSESLLSALGKVRSTTLDISPDPHDQSHINAQLRTAKLITERYTQDPLAGLPGVTLPEVLPVPTNILGLPLIERRAAGIPSVKELLKQEFQPLGYKYKSSLSGQGCYTLEKKGISNFVIGVFVDVSPIGGQFCANFFVRTPYDSFSLPVKLPPFGRDYPVDHHLPAVVKNTAFVAQKLEETYVMELQRALDPAPSWFAESALSG